jgi:CHASE3 domain sensor protein
MYDDVYHYSLETILEHITVCNKRFTEINKPTDFVSSEYGKILLDAIVTRLQAISENIKNNSQKNNLLQKITLILSGIRLFVFGTLFLIIMKCWIMRLFMK